MKFEIFMFFNFRNGNITHGDMPIPDRDVVYRYDVLPETFHARDNVSNFISWCRSLNIKECLLFETDDLVLRKNERSFILCLLEVARRGVKVGMPAPLLVQLEQEIDAEIANDDDGYETLYVRQPQVVTNDLRSLHERVRFNFLKNFFNKVLGHSIWCPYGQFYTK